MFFHAISFLSVFLIQQINSYELVQGNLSSHKAEYYDEKCNRSDVLASPEDVSCTFETSTCCWYSNIGSGIVNWTLSNSIEIPEISEPENGDGFLVLNNTFGQDNMSDNLWSPLFVMPFKTANFSLEAFCGDDAELSILLRDPGSPKVFWKVDDVCADIEGKWFLWNTVLDFSKMPDNSTFTIMMHGQVDEEPLAVKNFRILSNEEVTDMPTYSTDIVTVSEPTDESTESITTVTNSSESVTNTEPTDESTESITIVTNSSEFATITEPTDNSTESLTTGTSSTETATITETTDKPTEPLTIVTNSSESVTIKEPTDNSSESLTTKISSTETATITKPINNTTWSLTTGTSSTKIVTVTESTDNTAESLTETSSTVTSSTETSSTETSSTETSSTETATITEPINNITGSLTTATSSTEIVTVTELTDNTAESLTTKRSSTETVTITELINNTTGSLITRRFSSETVTETETTGNTTESLTTGNSSSESTNGTEFYTGTDTTGTAFSFLETTPHRHNTEQNHPMEVWEIALIIAFAAFSCFIFIWILFQIILMINKRKNRWILRKGATDSIFFDGGLQAIKLKILSKKS